MDKKLQIQNMGHIYGNAEAVIVMPGGVAAAQDAEYAAPWITRAWTLQEATLCANTHVLILHPELAPGYDYEAAMSGSVYNITNIEGDLALSELQSLLRSWRVTIKKIDKETRETISSKEFAARCFGDDKRIISALQGVLAGHTPAMKRSAAWRSIWLRTSTKPQDMVFSVMHVLGVQIDVDYDRTREDLILELARKSASLPSWLDIGEGVPFDPRYGLVPALPPFNPNHTPAYIVGDASVPVGEFITKEQYISDYDIKILTPATASHDGDIVCAKILEIHLR
ncbi:hypothetical protein DL766_005663 [Monosporascus sp. MC13-8B]|uniref:Uncharacterized protein n=1 Tax=Monosporascus cannonballus TaxID=155416 RepID=A0ABY0H5E4_9PEZI|nr:hypothetical protein DL762_005363 [Monosporascus cannonballus]RYO86835.1 hypothetical protein DL763_006543 [Monosporascus cannonballus]RYP28832.1 hypothetical protein DL766_005663 [Monosporascus sp. MC13-8B]